MNNHTYYQVLSGGLDCSILSQCNLAAYYIILKVVPNITESFMEEFIVISSLSALLALPVIFLQIFNEVDNLIFIFKGTV